MSIIKTYASNEEAYRELRNVEYIQANGTQWINTGLTINGAYSFEVLCKKGTDYGAIITGSSGNNDRMGFLLLNRVDYYWKGVSYRTLNIPNIDTSKKVKIIQDRNHINVSQDNISYDANYQGTSDTSTTQIRLFNYQIEGGYRYGSIYYCKIYNGSILLRDFQPVVLNNIGYLYDKVEHKLYGNDGEGAFAYGSIIVDITINPQNCGWVDRDILSSGALQLNAIANSGYEFVNWLLKGYTQLEYIESSGTQYIDTGYKITSNTARFQFEYYSASIQDTSVFGELNGTGSLGIWLDLDSTYGGMLAIGGIQASSTFSSTEWRTGKHEFDINIINKATTLLVDGVSKGTKTCPNNIYDNRNQILFARNFNGSINRKSSVKIYYYKIEENGVLVRDFIPVIRHIDGAIGLLDLVNLKFYGNNGTGEFIGGGVYAS